MNRILLHALLALTLTSAAIGGGTISWPTPPLPPDVNPAASPLSPLTGWLNHFQQNLDASRKMGKIDLIFDGDSYSIIANPKGEHGGIWSPRYASLNAFDFANPGDPTQTVLWRLQNGQVDGLHPKLVVLLVGSGNLNPNTPEQIAGGVKAVVQEYQKRCPEATILLEGIFPRREKPTDPLRLKIKAVNQLISAFGDGKKVIFLDFGDKFLQPDGTMTKEMLVDFSFPRPSPQAYKIWADAIKPAIDQSFPPSSTPAAASASASPGQSPASTSGTVGGTITWPSPPLPAGANAAVIPTPPMDRLNRLQQAIDDAHKMPQVGIIFDGDSITAGWKGGGGGVWNHHHYTQLGAVDFGVSGDSTQGLLWRVQNGQVDGLHPKLVVLLIGTNNMYSCSAEQIAGGIKADVEEYRKRLPDATVLLLGIFPRGEQPTDGLRAKVKEVNKIISALGDGKKVIFMDFGDKLLTADGRYTQPMTGDFLHPSVPGYEVWADSILPVIDQFFPPTATVTPASSPAK